MKIYKKCPCCGKTMFLMIGSDFGNEIEFGSAFGNKDNIPHTDKDHQEDWHCLNNFLTCLDNSHGKVFISLKDKEKDKVPKEFKETILNWTEGGYKKEEESNNTSPSSSSPKPKEPKNPSQPKTLKEWYEDKQIAYQDYKLLTTPWTEEEEWEYQREIVLDTNASYSWAEIQDYLKKAKLAKQKEQEKRRKEQEIERKINDGKNWGNIHLDFKGEWGEDYKRRWITCGFSYETCKEWIDIGLTPSGEDGDNAFFCAWLRDKKGLSSQQVLNSGNVKRLREEYESTLTHWG